MGHLIPKDSSKASISDGMTIQKDKWTDYKDIQLAYNTSGFD